MDSVFQNLPNDLIIKILIDRKEIKKDDRYKRQFDAVINDIKFVGTKKYKSNPWPAKSSILHKLRYEYQCNDNMLLSKAVQNRIDEYDIFEVESWHWDTVRNMSRLDARSGVDCEETKLMSHWELEWENGEDIPEEDIEVEPFLHFVYNLYPEWGIRYLSQDKPDPWLPADAGFI
jgi:hypothetical protein